MDEVGLGIVQPFVSPTSIPAVLDPKVFKAYDVRGIYPDELDEAGAYAIGRAYVDEFEPRAIAVGRDMRLSSPSMAEAVIRGAADSGADVVDVGMVGTEMVYFAVGDRDLEGGIMVTASHNPKEYTGMKIVRRGALPVGGDSGLMDIRTRAMALEDVPKGQTPGHVREEDIWPRWVDTVLAFIDVDAVKPLRIVIDAANGMGGVMLPPVLERLPIDAVPYFFEPDGTFPNHEPNPLLPENREFIIGKVRTERADLGIAFDGDADRCFVVDELGRAVPPSSLTSLIAARELAKEPGASVIHNLVTSRAVPELVRELGGRPVRTRVGHSYIKATMAETDAVFGGEHSGHFYFRDFWRADSGMLAALHTLAALAETDRPLSSVLDEYERYRLSGEINSVVEEPAATVAAVEAAYAGTPGATVDHLDGLTVTTTDWWFNVRPSNTEPLLRLNVEGADDATMTRVRDDVLALIRSNP